MHRSASKIVHSLKTPRANSFLIPAQHERGIFVEFSDTTVGECSVNNVCNGRSRSQCPCE